MKEQISKLQILVYEENNDNSEKSFFKDLYFNLNCITGFYVSDEKITEFDKDRDENGEVKSVCLFTYSGLLYVKAEMWLQEYLTERFVVPSRNHIYKPK